MCSRLNCLFAVCINITTSHLPSILNFRILAFLLSFKFKQQRKKKMKESSTSVINSLKYLLPFFPEIYSAPIDDKNETFLIAIYNTTLYWILC